MVCKCSVFVRTRGTSMAIGFVVPRVFYRHYPFTFYMPMVRVLQIQSSAAKVVEVPLILPVLRVFLCVLCQPSDSIVERFTKNTKEGAKDTMP